MKNACSKKIVQILRSRGVRARVRLVISVSTFAFLAACSESLEDPYNLYQGGELTIFDNTTMAYDSPSPPVEANAAYYDRWSRGDIAYDTDRVANSLEEPPPQGTGGLGPLYVGKSCATCHAGTGRTKSTLFTHGGTGYDFSSFLAFVRTPNEQYHRSIGRVLHDHAIYGVEPEGRLQVKYTLLDDDNPVCWEEDGICDPADTPCAKWRTPPDATGLGYCLIREDPERCGRFDDGERYCLIRPHYRITDWYDENISADRMRLSVRTPLRHVGLGLMMAVDREELKALAERQYPEYGISGRLQWVVERGRREIGLSGHKAQHADLTVELGFLSDIGVTNPRFPDEIARGQSQVTEDFGIEVSSEEMADVDLYMFGAGVPARRNHESPQVLRGEEMFYRAKCHLCHTPTLHTGPEAPVLIDGTRMPMLSNQTIHPYSDFLLHDMGSALGDDFGQWEASGDEWRTPMLWGIGLQEIVDGHTHYLHDGRARNMLEAIMWHFDMEGSASVEIFKRMTREDREALIAFIHSL